MFVLAGCATLQPAETLPRSVSRHDRGFRARPQSAFLHAGLYPQEFADFRSTMKRAFPMREQLFQLVRAPDAVAVLKRRNSSQPGHRHLARAAGTRASSR
jgi:hypothetical protein